MDIKVLDSALAFKALVDNYESFFNVVKHGDMSSARVTIKTNKNNVNLLTKNAWIYTDDKMPFIITENPATFDASGQVTTVYAFDVWWLFGGRASNITSDPIVYIAKSVEYIVKDLITKAIVNPTDNDRKISYLELAANQDRGSTINATVYQTPLDDDLRQLLAIDSMGLYGYYNETTKKIVVDIYEGTDRSVGNIDGNAPVMFDIKFDNIVSGEKRQSGTFVKNVSYVLGVDGGERVIKKVGSSTGVDRREIVVDAGDTDDDDEMDAIGTAALVNEDKSIRATVDALKGSFVYGADYRLGDIVNVMGDALRMVQAEQVRESGKTHQLHLAFGKREMDVQEQMQQNTASIKRLETKLVDVASNGWIKCQGNWSRTGDNELTVIGDLTEVHEAKQKFKLVQNGVEKYGYFTSVNKVGADTVITTSLEETLTAHEITEAYYSMMYLPFGFPYSSAILWTGTWNAGSILVNGLSKYSKFEILTPDTSTPMTAGFNSTRTLLRGYCVYPSGTAGIDVTLLFSAAVSGDNLTYVTSRRLTHNASLEHGISVENLSISGIRGIV